MSNPISAPKILATEVATADRLINEQYRSHPYLGGKKFHGVPCDMFQTYRQMGMLDEVAHGSWEETTLVHLMENQRTIKEC